MGKNEVLNELKANNPNVKFCMNYDNGKILVSVPLRQLHIPVDCHIDNHYGYVYKGGHPRKDPFSECVELESQIKKHKTHKCLNK